MVALLLNQKRVVSKVGQGTLRRDKNSGIFDDFFQCVKAERFLYDTASHFFNLCFQLRSYIAGHDNAIRRHYMATMPGQVFKILEAGYSWHVMVNQNQIGAWAL